MPSSSARAPIYERCEGRHVILLPDVVADSCQRAIAWVTCDLCGREACLISALFWLGYHELCEISSHMIVVFPVLNDKEAFT